MFLHRETQQCKGVDFTQVKYVHLMWSWLRRPLASFFFSVSRQVDYLSVLVERIIKWELPGGMQWGETGFFFFLDYLML